MQLILSPKDNLNKIILENVETFALEGQTLLVVFEDGHTRNYPLMHLWYYRSDVDNHKLAKVDKAVEDLWEKLRESDFGWPVKGPHPDEIVKPGEVTCEDSASDLDASKSAEKGRD